MDEGPSKDQKAAADAFCKEHLGDCCAELLEFRKTGLLRDGKVRQLAALMPWGGHDALGMAELAVHVEAMRACAARNQSTGATA